MIDPTYSGMALPNPSTEQKSLQVSSRRFSLRLSRQNSMSNLKEDIVSDSTTSLTGATTTALHLSTSNGKLKYRTLEADNSPARRKTTQVNVELSGISTATTRAINTTQSPLRKRKRGHAKLSLSVDPISHSSNVSSNSSPKCRFTHNSSIPNESNGKGNNVNGRLSKRCDSPLIASSEDMTDYQSEPTSPVSVAYSDQRVLRRNSLENHDATKSLSSSPAPKIEGSFVSTSDLTSVGKRNLQNEPSLNNENSKNPLNASHPSQCVANSNDRILSSNVGGEPAGQQLYDDIFATTDEDSLLSEPIFNHSSSSDDLERGPHPKTARTTRRLRSRHSLIRKPNGQSVDDGYIATKSKRVKRFSSSKLGPELKGAIPDPAISKDNIRRVSEGLAPDSTLAPGGAEGSNSDSVIRIDAYHRPRRNASKQKLVTRRDIRTNLLFGNLQQRNVDSDMDSSRNNDYCETCGEEGHFLCCDSCPRSFHFICIDPPVDPNALPPENWYCNACRPNLQPKYTNRIFRELLKSLDSRNPTVFTLPPPIKTYFKGVAEGPSGEYIDMTDIKSAKLGKTCQVDETDLLRLKDKAGNIILCHRCGRSALAGAILRCDFCPLAWHLDCLDPPTICPPPASRKWMCPNHAIHAIPRQRHKKVEMYKTPPHPFVSNSGDIQIVNDVDTDEHYSGQAFKVPEYAIKVKFFETARK
ncbi:uncharacterized protein VTP21DRAFT_10491 [Calcarisporiella thermophila]|uniref:uncharacterized protein n=1 Tax=Calcarisporiella thermophila TaxID=911321 RepID=UPI003743F52C